MQQPHKIIAQIRSLLDALDTELKSDEDIAFLKNFDALELPAIISAIVNHLQPLMLPYEAAIYWFLFRQSIIATGQQYARVSNNRLRTGVITSARSSQTTTLSEAAVLEALRGLESKGVIQKAGDTNREGTLYKVCLPEEIPAALERMQASEKQEAKELDLVKDLDFYNVAENRLRIFERDGYKCHYCSKQLTRFSATLDHIQPVSEGGDNSYKNLITSCLHCNSRRGAKPVMEFLTGDPRANQPLPRTPASGAAEL